MSNNIEPVVCDFCHREPEGIHLHQREDWPGVKTDVPGVLRCAWICSRCLSIDETPEGKKKQIKQHIVNAFQEFAAHQILVSEVFGDCSEEMDRHNMARHHLERYASLFGMDAEMMYDGVIERPKG